jgi:RimJ/RimL family protein N-acetyltransferase
MKLVPLYAPKVLELAAGWLAQKENYQWLDFGNGTRIISPTLLKVMVQRETHYLRAYTSNRADTPIGLVGLNSINSEFKTATFWGLSGDKSFANRGYSTYASSRLMSIAFGELGLVSVNTWAVEHNPSIRTIERLGFRRVGRQRRCHWIDERPYDRLLFDLLAEEHREIGVPRAQRSAQPERETAREP